MCWVRCKVIFSYEGSDERSKRVGLAVPRPEFLFRIRIGLSTNPPSSSFPTAALVIIIMFAFRQCIVHDRTRVIRLSLGSRRLVNLLAVAERTNALTNGVVGRTMGRWS